MRELCEPSVPYERATEHGCTPSHECGSDRPSDPCSLPVLESTVPERTILGKPHPDRAKQFKPFAALKGYEDLVAQQIREASAVRDFSALEDPC